MIVSINTKKCIGCGRCELICPMDAIRLDTDDKATIAYHNDCQTCYQCEIECKSKAIHVSPLRKNIPQPLNY